MFSACVICAERSSRAHLRTCVNPAPPEARANVFRCTRHKNWHIVDTCRDSRVEKRLECEQIRISNNSLLRWATFSILPGFPFPSHLNWCYSTVIDHTILTNRLETEKQRWVKKRNVILLRITLQL